MNAHDKWLLEHGVSDDYSNGQFVSWEDMDGCVHYGTAYVTDPKLVRNPRGYVVREMVWSRTLYRWVYLP